jgi:hypothetical protein
LTLADRQPTHHVAVPLLQQDKPRYGMSAGCQALHDRRFGMTARDCQADGGQRSYESLGWRKRQTQGRFRQPISENGFRRWDLVLLQQAHDLDQQPLIAPQLSAPTAMQVETAQRRPRDNFERPPKCRRAALRNASLR